MAPHIISGDYNVTLMEWINEYRQYSFWGGLEHTIGNYYVPYNIFLDFVARAPLAPWFWIALTSCIADYVGAYYIYRLVYECFGKKNPDLKKKAIIVAIVTLYLPVVMMNGALWKQCDSIFTCFIIMSLYYYFTDKVTVSFIWLSISFIFKMQVIFIIPFYIIMYFVKKNISILHFFFLPVAYVIAGLPCIWAQRGIRETYSVYIRQNQGYNEMTWLSLSPYQLGFESYEIFAIPAILFTATVFALGLLYCYKHRENIDKEFMLMLAAWSASTCYVFLPAMHERYDYVALILITAFVVAFDVKKIWIPLVMNLCTVMVYNRYLFDFEIIEGIPFMIMSIMYLGAYLVYTYNLIKRLQKQ